MHANGGDLRASGPHSGQPFNALRRDPEIRQGIDDRLLDCSHIKAHIALPFAQVQDRIPDYLPRTMIRHIAAAVALAYGNSRAFEHFSGCQQVLLPRIPPQRHHVRMLHKQEPVRNLLALALFNQLPLKPVRRSPIQNPKILDF